MRVHTLILVLLLSAQSRAPVSTNRSIDGTWLWKAPGGWQRITLDLKTNAGKLSGTLVMGPGRDRGSGKNSAWEYFFEPAVFPILRGSVAGNTIAFEQDLPILAPTQPVTNIVPAIAGTERLKYTGTLNGDSLMLVRENVPRPREREKEKDPFAIGRHNMKFTMTRTGGIETVSTIDAIRSNAVASVPRTFSMDVGVTNSEGRPVDDLRPEDFIVTEDNNPRPVSNVTIPSARVNVLLMFDHNLTWLQDSGQDSERFVTDAWNALLGSAMSFLNSLRPVDRFAAAVFEDNASLAFPWRSVRDVGRTASLGAVVRSPVGQKNLYGAIAWAKDQFTGASGRKVAVLFTDGRDGRLAPKWFRDADGREVLDPLFGLEDAGEREEFENVMTTARQSGLRLYFIAVNTARDPEFGPAIIGRRISGLFPGAGEGIAGYLARVDARMTMLAEATGGKVLYGNTPQEAISHYAKLRSELGIGTTYSLEFASAKPTDGGFRQIDVKVRRDGLRVTQSHKGFYAR